jgi:hypothetical protein
LNIRRMTIFGLPLGLLLVSAFKAIESCAGTLAGRCVECNARLDAFFIAAWNIRRIDEQSNLGR